MNPLISICIPTHQRPDLLQQAIASCLCQTYSPIEIVVCDDSRDKMGKQVVDNFNRPEVLRYYHNFPHLGQAKNVNQLFDLARGERLLLLHGDDLLAPNAVSSLAQCWNSHPHLIAAFGKQHLISCDGVILPGSEELNQTYHRTEQYAGYQKSSLWSALTAQFPNNGYLIQTKAAQQVRYSDSSEVGDACDFEFGLRLATQYDSFFFLNEYTAMYRLTDASVLRSNNYTNLTYQIIRSLTLPSTLEPVRQQCLQQYASPAINQYLQLGNKQAALEIFTSSYTWSNRLSVHGVGQALLIACPSQLSLEIVKHLRKVKQALRSGKMRELSLRSNSMQQSL